MDVQHTATQEALRTPEYFSIAGDSCHGDIR